MTFHWASTLPELSEQHAVGRVYVRGGPLEVRKPVLYRCYLFLDGSCNYIVGKSRRVLGRATTHEDMKHLGHTPCEP